MNWSNWKCRTDWRTRHYIFKPATYVFTCLCIFTTVKSNRSFKVRDRKLHKFRTIKSCMTRSWASFLDSRINRNQSNLLTGKTGYFGEHICCNVIFAIKIRISSLDICFSASGLRVHMLRGWLTLNWKPFSLAHELCEDSQRWHSKRLGTGTPAAWIINFMAWIQCGLFLLKNYRREHDKMEGN